MITNKGGRKKTYNDNDFINVLTYIPQTTSQVRTELKKLDGYEHIIHDTVLKNLLRIEETGTIEKIEVKAASRTGKIYLWKIKETENK